MTTTPKAKGKSPSSSASQSDFVDGTGAPIPPDNFENEIEPREPPLKGDALKDFDAETERLRKKK